MPEFTQPLRMANTQEMEVEVSGPNGANRLYTYTGMVEVEIRGGEPHPKWTQCCVTFPVGREFVSGKDKVLNIVATASLAAIRNEGVATFAGWRIYAAAGEWNEETGHVEMNVLVGARDSEGFVEQFAYQLNVLASVA